MSKFLSAKDLFEQIQQRNCVSKRGIQACSNDLDKVYKVYQKQIEKGDEKMTTSEVKEWVLKNKQHLKSFPDYKDYKSDDFLIEFLVVIMKGVWIAFDRKKPRIAQLISLWLNIFSPKTILEIKTGEGKTMIVAMTALYFALRGKKVDVFTSSSALAKTQTQTNSSVRKLFDLFNISLGDNCNQISDRSKTYQNQVIYGTSFQFQADYLQKIFCGRIQFFKDRNFDNRHVAILDEVDALLIDRMSDSTRISSQKPLFECIKALFLLIKEVKFELIKAKNTFVGQLKVKILGQEISFQQKVNEDSQDLSMQTFIQKQKKQIIHIVKGALKLKIKYLFPNYLLKEKGYIQLMLPVWVNSSYEIQKYEQDVNYTVSKQTNQIIPIDISTGTYQKKTKWSNGVHQFLQLSHKFDVSVDSIVTNYESNLIFFKRYEHYLFGMTGTISQSVGKQKTKQEDSIFQVFLKQNYKVEIYKIPTAKQRLLKLQSPKVFCNKQSWLSAICKDSKQYSNKRLVLIIFQTIKQAKSFIGKFSQNKQYNIIQLHDYDLYFDSLSKKLDQQKTIIVSTNLGGRGTDIEIKNQNILKNGGLYVMMTYFASNWRIQQQAFGRAGRNGQPGSGCFYLNISDDNNAIKQMYGGQQQCTRLFKIMLQKRQKQQKNILSKSIIQIQNQLTKRELLDKFHEKYLKSSHQKLITIKDKINKQQSSTTNYKQLYAQKIEIIMQMQCAEQQWGIFLKKRISDQNRQQKIDVNFNDFVEQYQINRQNNDVNPGFFARCGSQLLLINQQKAQSYFKKALKKNQNSWVNRYYLVYFQLKKHNNKKISGQTAEYINKMLREVSNLIVIDYCLQVAISSSIQNSKKKQEQLDQIKKIYLREMGYLQSIGQTLVKYAVNQKKSVSFLCSLSNQTEVNSTLTEKGFSRSIKIEFLEKQGIFAGFFKGIGNLINGVLRFCYSALITVSALVASPFMKLFGAQTKLESMWNYVGDKWQKTGNQFQQFIKRLPSIALVGFGLLTLLAVVIFAFPSIGAMAATAGVFATVGTAVTATLGTQAVVATSAACAITSLISWIYLGNKTSLQFNQKEASISSYAFKLVQIDGFSKLGEEVAKKILTLRQQFAKKKDSRQSHYKHIKSQLNKLKLQQFRTEKNINNAERHSFRPARGNQWKEQYKNKQKQRESKGQNGKDKEHKQQKRNYGLFDYKNKYETSKKTQFPSSQNKFVQKASMKNQQNKQSKTQIQEEQQISYNKKQAIVGILKQIKTLQKAQESVDKLQKAKQKKQQSLIQTIKQIAMQKVKKVQLQIKSQQKQLNLNCANNKINNIDIESFQHRTNKKLQQCQQLQEDLCNYTKQKINIQRVPSLEMNDPIKPRPQSISRSIPIQNSQKLKLDLKIDQFNLLQTTQAQTLDLFNGEQLLSNPLGIKPSTIASGQARDLVTQFQGIYHEKMYENIQKKFRQEQREEESQMEQAKTKILQQTDRKQSQFNSTINTPPIEDISKINKYYYYRLVVEQKCIYENIGFGSAEDIDQLGGLLKNHQTGGQLVAIINKTLVLYRKNHITICKIYQEKSEETDRFLKQLSAFDNSIKILYADKRAINSTGTHIISDVSSFIQNQDDIRIDCSGKTLSPQQIKKEYVRAILIKCTPILLQREQHAHIMESRKNKKSTLPSFFLPFEYQMQSKSFKNFEAFLTDQVCDCILKNQSKWKQYRYFVESIRYQISNEQAEIIKDHYPQLMHLVVKNSQKKPNRHRR